MAKYSTIDELVSAIRRGDVDESKLEIHTDNDNTYVIDSNFEIVNEEGEIDGWKDEGELFKGCGYGDIDELWQALFPKATILPA